MGPHAMDMSLHHLTACGSFAMNFCHRVKEVVLFLEVRARLTLSLFSAGDVGVEHSRNFDVVIIAFITVTFREKVSTWQNLLNLIPHLGFRAFGGHDGVRGERDDG